MAPSDYYHEIVPMAGKRCYTLIEETIADAPSRITL